MTLGPDEPGPSAPGVPLGLKIAAPIGVVLLIVGIVAVLKPADSSDAVVQPTNPRPPTTTTSTPHKVPRTTTPLVPPVAPQTSPTSPPAPQTPEPPPPAPSPTATTPVVPPAGTAKKTCADFARRIDAEIWMHYAKGVGLDTTGVDPDGNNVYCQSLPGPDL